MCTPGEVEGGEGVKGGKRGDVLRLSVCALQRQRLQLQQVCQEFAAARRPQRHACHASRHVRTLVREEAKPMRLRLDWTVQLEVYAGCPCDTGGGVDHLSMREALERLEPNKPARV